VECIGLNYGIVISCKLRRSGCSMPREQDSEFGGSFAAFSRRTKALSLVANCSRYCRCRIRNDKPPRQIFRDDRAGIGGRMRTMPNGKRCALTGGKCIMNISRPVSVLSPPPAEAVSNSTGAATERSFSSEIDGAAFFQSAIRASVRQSSLLEPMNDDGAIKNRAIPEPSIAIGIVRSTTTAKTGYICCK